MRQRDGDGDRDRDRERETEREREREREREQHEEEPGGISMIKIHLEIYKIKSGGRALFEARESET